MTGDGGFGKKRSLSLILFKKGDKTKKNCIVVLCLAAAIGPGFAATASDGMRIEGGVGPLEEEKLRNEIH